MVPVFGLVQGFRRLRSCRLQMCWLRVLKPCLFITFCLGHGHGSFVMLVGWGVLVSVALYTS